jgi:integrase
VLQAAVERGYLEKNPAHGIRIRETDAKPERRFYSPVQVRQLLTELKEPCRTVVLLAVFTGMRIGEALALRWRRVDMVRGALEIAETFSDGQFGSPQTRSSNRVIPMSTALRVVLESNRVRRLSSAPDDLVFCTPKGTPLSSKNLYNRVLAPACDRLKLRRVSWHSFRRTHATMLSEVGGSLKTAQALAGPHGSRDDPQHLHARNPGLAAVAVDRVAGVLFSDVLELEPDANEPGTVN